MISIAATGFILRWNTGNLSLSIAAADAVL
jgi:hypothetical protein